MSCLINSVIMRGGYKTLGDGRLMRGKKWEMGDKAAKLVPSNVGDGRLRFWYTVLQGVTFCRPYLKDPLQFCLQHNEEIYL